MKNPQSVQRGSKSGPAVDLRSRIVRHVADLSPQQRVIAGFVLTHLHEIPVLSAPELAARTGVSEATLMRFCQRVGYSGYSDLKNGAARFHSRDELYQCDCFSQGPSECSGRRNRVAISRRQR